MEAYPVAFQAEIVQMKGHNWKMMARDGKVKKTVRYTWVVMMR